MTSPTQGLLDTSVLIATESGRPLDTAALPDEVFVSVVTIAELHAGVLAAADTATRSRRLATLDAMSSLEPLPIDVVAASHWARLRVRLHEEGRRVNVNDLWIAAVAAANNLPVVSQDSDYDALESIGGPAVIRV
ncbi:MAG: type II toxin-antitoxin system VapC family toxin [Actinobacteria bacterium]|nr:type II toxin-antitoxin system VapC family toxin [Actinomycetota bacterium]